jgi:excisionase family DNA binding protein
VSDDVVSVAFLLRVYATPEGREMPDKMLLKPSDAAAAISVSRSRLYELIHRREIPHIRVGTSIRIPVDALQRWINERLRDEQV